jgi:hypothetical protein
VAINGNITLIAHLGYPTSSCEALMIYNPYSDAPGINRFETTTAADLRRLSRIGY